ncbi:MAG: hypothetical protein A2V73_03570 [candidate division Zixibacteria bacterium RBG_19FT_COMBO_42_43]|nr:MAG: hypothetical protein A2V73_03570 [candidate division Zixibacteria bacterium RBG_19FT_COMBO_42_43]
MNEKPFAKLTIGRGMKVPRNPFESHYHFFKNGLKILTNLNKILPQSVEDYRKSFTDKMKEKIKKLDKEGKRELKKFYNYIEKTRTGNKQFRKRSVIIKHETVNKLLREQLDMSMFSSRFNMFIREMSLVYLIAEFEQFLGRSLALIFDRQPDIIKSSKKQISYEELFDYKNFEEVKEKIIEKEVNSLTSQDIDDVNKYLNERFKLDLTQHENWKKFKECFYRRNIVIHNSCYPDETYRKKTGYKGKHDRLSITKPYLSRCIKLFEMYSEIIRDVFTKKFI